jgi:CheY-like chemotaxis protein
MELNPPGQVPVLLQLSMKVLVVEDNEMSSDMLIRRLSRKGYEVVLAVDGAQAVDMARAHRPDIVLMDISLPVMDGLSATREIKGALDTGDIPVIALTAHAMAGDEEQCRAAGADDYDTKPVDLPRLLAKMEVLLKAPRAP